MNQGYHPRKYYLQYRLLETNLPVNISPFHIERFEMEIKNTNVYDEVWRYVINPNSNELTKTNRRLVTRKIEKSGKDLKITHYFSPRYFISTKEEIESFEVYSHKKIHTTELNNRTFLCFCPG